MRWWWGKKKGTVNKPPLTDVAVLTNKTRTYVAPNNAEGARAALWNKAVADEWEEMLKDLAPPPELSVLEQFRKLDYSKMFIRNVNGGWQVEHRWRISNARSELYMYAYPFPVPFDLENFAPEVETGARVCASFPTWDLAMAFAHTKDRAPAEAPIPLDRGVYH